VSKPQKKKPLTHRQIATLLRKRYQPPEWVVFEEIQPGVGWDVGRRTDMLALSTWQSRGLRLLGFEIKSSRADVLKELADPAKAEATARFCDFWYLVLGRADLCGKDEVPATWGLIAPHGTGLRIVKHAESLNPAPWSRDLVCMLMRRASGNSISDQQRAASVEEGRKQGLDTAAWQVKRLEELEAKIKLFKKHTGIELSAWTGDERVARIGGLVNELLNGGVERYHNKLRYLAENAQRLGKDLAKLLEQTEEQGG